MRTKVLNYFHTFHPEAQAEHDRLAKEEARLTLALARRGEDDAPRRRMSQPMDDLDAELAKVRVDLEEQRAVIASGVVRIIIKGLSRGEYRRLLVEHGPREDDPLDDRLGYNTDSFGEALIRACIVRTEDLDGNIVANEWDVWADEMTNGQWEEIFTACHRLTNEGSPAFPR